MAIEDLNTEPVETPDGDNSVPESTVPADEPAVPAGPPANDDVTDLRYELARARSAADARLAQLENLLVQVATGGIKKEQVEDIDFDDPAALYKLMQKDMDAKLADERRRHEGELNMLKADQFNATVTRINEDNPEVVKRFKHEIDQYYTDHPNERFNPNSYPTLIKYFKGELYDEQQRKRRSAVPTTPNPVPPRGPSPPPENPRYGFTDDDEAQHQRLARIYGMLEGKDIIPIEEWNTVREDRKKFPGRRGGR